MEIEKWKSSLDKTLDMLIDQNKIETIMRLVLVSIIPPSFYTPLFYNAILFLIIITMNYIKFTESIARKS